MIKQPDGNVYWLPQVMPYGDGYRNPNPFHGVWVQAAVLESWGWEYPTNLEDLVHLIVGEKRARFRSAADADQADGR